MPAQAWALELTPVRAGCATLLGLVSRLRPLHIAVPLCGERLLRSLALAVAPLAHLPCLARKKERYLATDEGKREPRIVLQRQPELRLPITIFFMIISLGF